MAGPGGVEVGRVSIRVVPNFDKFHKRMDALYKKYKKKPLRVKVEVDSKELDNLTSGLAKQAKIDSNKAGKVIANELGKATKGSKLRVEVNTVPNTKNFLDSLNTQLRIARSQAIKLPLDVDSSGVFAKIKALEAAAGEINLELEIPAAQKAKIIAEIAALQGAIKALKIVPDLKPPDISKFVPNFGTGLNLPAYGAIILAVLTLIAPIIGLITTGLLAIPGILATFMAPIGAIVLGFKGIQKAAEKAGLFQDTNGDKKGGGSLGAALTDLQKKVEDVFENTLTEPFKKLGNVANSWVAPLETVAQGAADIMAGMVNSITSEVGSSRIAETFSAIGRQLSDNFAPGIEKMTDALIGLAHEFTTGGALEGLGDWFNDTMGDFRDWVNEAAESGDLTTMFEGLGSSLKVVADALGGMAKDGLDFMKDPEKVEGFVDALGELKDVLTDITNVSEKLGPIFKLIDLMGSVPSLASVVSGGSNSSESATPDTGAGGVGEAWEAARIIVAEKIEQIKANVEQMWVDLKTSAVMKATEIFSGIVSGLRSAFIVVTTELPFMVGYAIGMMAGTVFRFFAELPGKIMAVMYTLPGVVSSALGGIVSAVVTKAGEIAAELRTWPGKFLAALGSLATVLAQEGVNLVQGLLTAVIVKFGEVTTELGTWPGRLVDAVGDLFGSFAELGRNAIRGLIAGLKDSSLIGMAMNAASSLLNIVRGVAGKAVGEGSPAKSFIELGENIGAGLSIGIGNGGAGAISAIREVMQAIKDVFGSAEGINLNFYMGESKSAMSSMATSSKEFRSNMSGAVADMGTASTVESGLVEDDLADIKRKKAEIDLQIAQLQAQKNATADKAAKAGLTAEIDQLRIQKERLDLLKEENGLQEERKTAIQQLSDTIATNIVDMMKMPGEFAKTTANAAMQDLGISGSGALPTIANWAMDAGTNFIFNVNNMDDALQGQQSQQRKQAAGIAGGR